MAPRCMSSPKSSTRNRDHVVSKDDLLAAVWHGRIVSDSTLNNRVNGARRAIGDSGERQRFIRTVARRGFRFVGDLDQEPGQAEGADGSAPADQEVTFCRAADAVHLAVAQCGSGRMSSRPPTG